MKAELAQQKATQKGFGGVLTKEKIGLLGLRCSLLHMQRVTSHFFLSLCLLQSRSLFQSKN
jgi:hypothetical protein